MRKKTLWILTLAVLTVCVPAQIHSYLNVYSQGRGTVTPEVITKRNDIERELQSIAVVERKLMIPMRDGVRIATDVYRPKDTSRKYPTIFVRTPYNFNFWDVRNGAPRGNVCCTGNAITAGSFDQRSNESRSDLRATMSRLDIAFGSKCRASNFPRFDRNLNTGGRNWDESKPVVARNAIHHSRQYPSEITITVVRKGS